MAKGKGKDVLSGDAISLTGLMTAQEVAETLRCHRSQVTRLIKNGSLSGFRAGTKLLIPREEIARFLSANRT